MDDFEKNSLPIIESILDEVMEEFSKDKNIIFSNESDRKKEQYAHVHSRLKSWKKSQTCVVPGCVKKSILNSHTIPESMSLRSIAENGKVITIGFDNKTGTLRSEEIGVGIASVFPGYCEEHENLFHDFESVNKMDVEKHYVLQIYRSVCREIFRIELEINSGNKIKVSYANKRDNRLLEIFKEKADKYGLTDLDYKTFSLKNDPLEDALSERIINMERTLSELKTEFLQPLEDILFHGKEGDITLAKGKTDKLIPVGISGLGNFSVKNGEKEKVINFIVSVIPEESETNYILCSSHSNSSILENYTQYWSQSPLHLLNMIESWMIHGTDQWYIRPSVWNKLSEIKRNKILSDILKFDRNICEEYDNSIFNDIRIEVIEFVSKNIQYLEDIEKWKVIMDREKSKL